MRYGYFDDENREYVIDRPDTPASWTNYIGCKTFGAVINNNAGGYSFVNTAALGRFTRLHFNSIPMDQPGKYFYIRDNDTGDFWSASWQPVGKDLGDYETECRFGTSYANFNSKYADIRSESSYFIPLDQLFEYWRLNLTNEGDKPRNLSVFTYCEFTSEWNIFQDTFNRQYSAYCTQSRWKDGFIECTSLENCPEDPDNFKNGDQGRWLWMTAIGADVSGYDLDRDDFIGAYRSYHNPRAVAEGVCQNSTAYGRNSCGCMKMDITLAPGENRDLMVMLGIGKADRDGKKIAAEFGNAERADAEMIKLKEHWHSKLNVVQVKTPDEDFDHMFNVWGAYDALINFYWCRSAGFIYSGEDRDGFGYRDTIQDLLGVTHSIPEEVRQRMEFMLSAQESNGGAMPEVKPYAHYPGKTPLTPPAKQRSDDCIWLFNALPVYVNETGDWDFFDKVIPYSDQGEDTVFEHLKRALEFNLERSGAHGLPCGLHADWNDCLRLGFKGETVMLAFQIRGAWGIFADIATKLGKTDDATWALAQREKLDENLQKHTWDGEWFIRAYREKGDKLGSKECQEGKIFMSPQSWSVISGAASQAQAKQALDSADKHLATEFGLMVTSPPYLNADYNEIRAMVLNPGQKENGGIFNHMQGWNIIANCIIGDGDRAYRYYKAVMPSRYNDLAEVRLIEPYVHAQSTDSKESHSPGKSNLPWLTGSASWSHYTALQYILGIRPEKAGLRIDPCIPSTWDKFTVVRKFRSKMINIEVRNPNGKNKGICKMILNGSEIDGNLLLMEQLADTNEVICEIG